MSLWRFVKLSFYSWIVISWVWNLANIVINNKYPSHFGIGTAVFITLVTTIGWLLEELNNGN